MTDWVEHHAPSWEDLLPKQQAAMIRKAEKQHPKAAPVEIEQATKPKKPRKKRAHNLKLTPELIAAITRLRDSGVSSSQAMSELGITMSVLRRSRVYVRPDLVSDAVVAEIRESRETNVALSQRLGVSVAWISKIRNGRVRST